MSELRKSWCKHLGRFHSKGIPCANTNTITCHRVQQSSTLHPNPTRTPKIKRVQLSELR